MKKDHVLAVIPARLTAQRLPGKPLLDIAGKTLIQRVWEQAKATQSLSRVVISTDSEEIETVARSFGAEVVMTSSLITTGTQRVAEAWKKLKTEEKFDIVVNVQGDMPFISPQLIDSCVSFMIQKENQYSMVTAGTPIFSEEAFLSPNVVKIVLNQHSEALYFSRAAVPHSRSGDRLSFIGADGKSTSIFGFKHFGLYLFKPEVLSVYESSEMSNLEIVEKLEQLRLLENGHRIGVCIVDNSFTADSVEVDTAEDLTRAIEIAQKNQRYQ